MVKLAVTQTTIIRTRITSDDVLNILPYRTSSMGILVSRASPEYGGPIEWLSEQPSNNKPHNKNHQGNSLVSVVLRRIFPANFPATSPKKVGRDNNNITNVEAKMIRSHGHWPSAEVTSRGRGEG